MVIEKFNEKKLNIEYIKLTVGFVLSTLTVPLLTSVDTAVVGQLTNPAYIAGVGLGATIFNTIYWIFGFLRVSTSGYSAMAYGSKNKEDELMSLLRPMTVGIIMGLIFIIFQGSILNIAKMVYKSTPEIIYNMEIYYKILIWGSPLVFLNYSMLGWIMGRKKVMKSLFLQLATNGINIILDFYFVYGLNLGVAGVAYATLIAQLSSTILAILIILNMDKKEPVLHIVKKGEIKIAKIFDKKIMKDTGKVNINLMLRTMCLLLVLNLFMRKGASYGEVILAGNTILYQIQGLIFYFFDGFGNSASVIMGNGVGEKNIKKIDWIIEKSYKMCLLFSIVVMVVLFFGLENIFILYTNNKEVLLMLSRYKWWVMLFPPCISIALVYYGLFTGTANTNYIRNSMIQALIPYFLVYFLLIPILKNDGLWISALTFAIGRSIFLYRYLPKLKDKVKMDC